jgi:hypothetical protein
MKNVHLFLAIGLLASGCAPQFEGIRMRAHSPGIDEAFRKIGIAVGLEGFQLTRNEPESHTLETAWRDMRKDERGPDEGTPSGTPMQARLTVGVVSRGMMYDVLIGVYVRGADERGVVRETAVPPGHPLAVKWQRILGALVERESREED